MIATYDIQKLAAVFKGDIGPTVLAQWLSQFDPEDLESIVPLIEHFKYYSSEDVFHLLEVLYRKLLTEVELNVEQTWFVPSGYVAKSGDAIAYFFRRSNNLPDDAFIRAADLNENLLNQRHTVVFLDDFIGSGQLLLQTENEVVARLARVKNTRFIYAAMVGYQRGIQRSEDDAYLRVCVSETLGSDAEPFSEASEVFPDRVKRQQAETVVKKYAERCGSKNPLGYGSTQGLISFFFGTPNNTLPIFWRSAPSWLPLLPHGDPLRDPKRMVELPERLDLTSGGDAHENELDFSKEATAALFDGFQTLQNMGIAGRALAHLGFSDAGIRDLVNAIQTLEEDVHEKNAVCTGILCPSQNQVQTLLNEVFVRFDPPLRVSDVPTLRAAGQLVGGFEGALVLNSTGEIHGALTYRPATSNNDLFLPDRYARAAAAAKRADGLAVVLMGNGRVAIIDRGIRILTRRIAKWHPVGIPTRLREMEAEHGLANRLLDSAFKAGFILADSGLGAIVTFGDAERVLSFTSKGPPSSFVWQRLSLTNDDLLPLLLVAHQDGATILDEQGEMRATMTILHPPATVRTDDETGKGARHTTAAKVSASSGALTMAVSEDGTITLYSKGRRVLRVMG